MVSDGEKANEMNENERALEWIHRLQNGDDACFELLFRQYYQRLSRFAWRYVRSTAIAEELVQDLFAHLWESRRTLSIDGSVQSYLFAAIRNRCLNLIKQERAKEEHDRLWMEERVEENRPDLPTRSLEEDREQQIRLQIRNAVDALPRLQRLTYQMSRLDGLTYKEIARVHGVSVKAVEKQMAHALRSLRDRLSHLLPFRDV